MFCDLCALAVLTGLACVSVANVVLLTLASALMIVVTLMRLVLFAVVMLSVFTMFDAVVLFIVFCSLLLVCVHINMTRTQCNLFIHEQGIKYKPL